MKIAVGAAILLLAGAVIAFLLPAIRERDEAIRQEEIRQDIERDRRKVVEREALRRAVEAKRAALLSQIKGASDDQLIALYRDCEKHIAATISAERKAEFAVYFPNYGADDLQQLFAMARAVRASSGRPSVILNREDFLTEQIGKIRKIPGIISVVAESASDSFSGVKKWAAVFDCELQGLAIRSVTRNGSREFFD